MQYDPQLNELFESEVKKYFEAANKQRAQLMKHVFVAVLVGLLLAGILFAANSIKGVWVCLGVFFVGICFYSNHMQNKKKEMLKANVTRKLLTAFDPELRYYPHNHMEESEFLNSGIFTSSHNIFQGEDLVRGKFEDIPLAFSELQVEYETRNSKGNSTKTTIFKGLFMKIDCNKHFKSSTIVVPDVAERGFGQVVGNFLQKMNVARKEQLTRMENVEFEKIFAVYTLDPVEARYLLSPKMMEQMVALSKQYNNVAFSFRNSAIYIAVPLRKNLFEFDGSLDFDSFKKLYYEMSQFLGFVHELGLNIRIWSKK